MTITANSERGVALLTILLLVVSITVVAGAMLASQKIVIRRSGLLFEQDQLAQDLLAGQQLAVTVIRADNKLNDTDSLQDIWAQPLPPYTLGTHSIGVELRDEGSRFNVNNLYHDGKADEAALAVFERLLTQLNIDSDIAVALLDWQDADTETYKDGGDEGTVYTQQNSGDTKTLPNQPVTDIDQLQDVRGVDADVLATLRPYLTAVPYYLPVNVNTASPELLSAFFDGVTAAQLKPVTDMRQQRVINSVDEIWQLPMLSTVSQEQRQSITPLLSVNSQAFSALITATDSSDMDSAKQRFATVLLSNTVVNTNNANVNQPATGNNTEQSTKEVTVVSQRLWAFRPVF